MDKQEELLKLLNENKINIAVTKTQLDSITESVGELKGIIQKNHESQSKCLTNIKRDLSSLKQWKKDHDKTHKNIDSEFKALRSRINTIASIEGFLTVIGSAIATFLGMKN